MTYQAPNPLPASVIGYPAFQQPLITLSNTPSISVSDLTSMAIKVPVANSGVLPGNFSMYRIPSLNSPLRCVCELPRAVDLCRSRFI